MGSSATYLDPIIVPLIKGESVLDVGCGWGRWGNLIHTNYWEAGLKVPPIVDGLDAFEENVKRCLKLPCYRKVWHQVLPSLLSGKWDTVLASEIIEHIEQEKVEDVIQLLENAAQKRIIITTPNWSYIRDQGGSNNPFEAHLSYIPRDFFRKRGYNIIGAGFGNPCNRFVQKLLRFKSTLAFTLQSVSRIFPSFGVMIVAYKDIKN